MVSPTISGTIIERRDQVLIGLRSFLADATCTFFARCRSTNGPFFNERGMCYSLRSADAVLAALDDHVVRALVVTRLQALGVPAPRRHRVRVALAGLALATAVRVVDGVHGETAHRRADALPALGARLAVAAQVVLVVPHLADRGAAVDVHLARLAGLQTQVRVDALARGEGHRASGAARDLAAAAGLQFHVVDDRADRHVAQRHRVARLDRRIGSRAHFIAGLRALGCQDVAPLAVQVLDEGDVAGAVRVVLEPLDDAGDAVLVALEVDDAVLLARAAALVARGDAAEVVAPAGLVLVRGELLARPALVEVRAVDLDDIARAGSAGLVLDESHGSVLSGLGAGFLVDGLAGGEAHVGLLPVLGAPGDAA